MDPDSYFLCGQSEKKFFTCCGFLVLVTMIFILTILGLLTIRKHHIENATSFKMPKSITWVAVVVVVWELIRIVYLMQVFYWRSATECIGQIVQDLPFVFMFLTVVIAHDFMIELYCRLTDKFARGYLHMRKLYTFSTVIILIGLFLFQNANICGATTKLTSTQRKITDRNPLIAIIVISSYFSLPNAYFLVKISEKLKLKIGIEEIERKFKLLAWAVQIELSLYIVGASLYLYQAGKSHW